MRRTSTPSSHGAGSGPSTAWASSRTSSAPWRRQACGDGRRTGATSPSMEKTRSLTTMAGPRASASSASRCVDVGVAVDGDLGVGQAGTVDDRRVVELVRADPHAGVAERGQHPEVGRVAGREDARRARAPFQCGQLGLELVVHRARPGDQTRGAAAGAPAVEGLVGGRPPPRGATRQAQVVVGREGDDPSARPR